MTEALAKIVGTLEGAVRYLLTGSAITLIVLASRLQLPPVLQRLDQNLLGALVAVALIGFGSFTLYRLLMWTLLDLIAWKLRWSVPSLERTSGWSYAEPYARFLQWRHAPPFPASLASYLGYRWSAAHFATLSGGVAVVAHFLAEPGSLTARYSPAMLVFGALSFGIGIMQCRFLYRVERALCSTKSRDA